MMKIGPSSSSATQQNLGLAMSLADDVVLLDTGRVVFAGSAEAFNQQQDLLQAHLGVA